MQNDYTLPEAAERAGIALNTLRQRDKRGKLSIIQVERGGKLEKGISEETLQALLLSQENDTYEKTKTEFFAEMRAIGLRGTPWDDRHTGNVKSYLEQYWAKLGGKPSINRLNAENLKLVFAQYIPDREAKRFYDATRIHLYKSVSSFVIYLVNRRLVRESVLIDIRRCKPNRKHKPYRPMPELIDVHKAIDFNTKWTAYRSRYDVALLNILIALYAFAGLRKMEAAGLSVNCILLDGRALHVFGKGCKERIVPISPILAEHIAEWQEVRPESKWFVLSKAGEQLTEYAIQDKFARLKEHAEKLSSNLSEPITIYRPHDYRRAYVTFSRQAGVPDLMVQHSAGHSNRAMTEAYDQTNKNHILRMISNMPDLFRSVGTVAGGSAQQLEAAPQITRTLVPERDIMDF